MFWADQFNEDRVCLLALEGRLSRCDLANLSDRLRGLAAQGVHQVVLDLRAVDHWDYRGLPELAEAVKSRRRARATTAFITPSDYLRYIAGAAGVLEEMDFYDDLRLDEPELRLTIVGSSATSENEELRKATGL